jgi:myo-inositol-1(or 4)-monophosphatase
VQAEVVQHLIGKVRDLRRIGVGAIDLCYVACGRLDAAYERGLNPWDYGAGALIAAEAGATIGGLHGAPVSPEMSIAAAPGVFAALHDALAAAKPLRS